MAFAPALNLRRWIALSMLCLASCGCLGRNYDRSLGRITIPDSDSGTAVRDVLLVVEPRPDRSEGSTAGGEHPNITLRSQSHRTDPHANLTGLHPNLTLGHPNLTLGHPNLTWGHPNATFGNSNLTVASDPLPALGGRVTWARNGRVTQPDRQPSANAPDAPRIRYRLNPNLTNHH